MLRDDGADRGIIFVAAGARLDRQFDFVKTQWINDGVFIGAPEEKDPLLHRVEKRHTRSQPGGYRFHSNSPGARSTAAGLSGCSAVGPAFGRGTMRAVTGHVGNAPRRSRGMRDYVTSGWLLGGAALGFVLGNRALQRFVLVAGGIVLVATAGLAVVAVALRREAGPVGYVLVGLVAYYCLSLMVTAIAVGVAGLVADSLDSRPVTPATGWQVIRRRRRSIASWAVLDLVLGLPSRAVGSWTVEQLAVLLLGFGWALLSFFAIPTIALTGGSARSIARRSLRLVRGHWGAAVYSTVYLWVRAVVLFGLPATVAIAAGVLLIRNGAEVFGAALFAAGVAGLALAFLLSQVARAVLTVVLYRYADSRTVYPDFPAELLDRSIRGPSRVVRRLAEQIEGERVRRVRRRVLGDLEDAPSGPSGPPPP